MKNNKKRKVPRDPDERMTTVEVARYVVISYQTAYNRILGGVYGPSEYDPTTRTMSVRASAVRRAKMAQKTSSDFLRQ